METLINPRTLPPFLGASYGWILHFKLPAECLYSPQSALDSSQVTMALNFVHASTDYRLTPLWSRDVLFQSPQSPDRFLPPDPPQIIIVHGPPVSPLPQQSPHVIMQPTARSAIFSSASRQIVDPLRVVRPRFHLRSPASRSLFMHSCISSTQIA